MINSSANNLAFEDQILIEDDVGEPQKVLEKWRVLVVDDDDGVHQSTSFAIRGAKILGKEVDWVHAKSAQEAMDILSIDNGFELAIVEVVMENKHAGLDLAKWMRSRKSLEHTRIMLRTGQSGEVSEESVFDQAGVDDFRLKSELSHLRLISFGASPRGLNLIPMYRNSFRRPLAISGSTIPISAFRISRLRSAGCGTSRQSTRSGSSVFALAAAWPIWPPHAPISMHRWAITVS
jgi:CheY-like chemotaxis protein